MFRYRLVSLFRVMFAIAVVSAIARFHIGAAATVASCALFGGLLGRWVVGHIDGFIGGAMFSVIGALCGFGLACVTHFMLALWPTPDSPIVWTGLVIGGMFGGTLGGIFVFPRSLATERRRTPHARRAALLENGKPLRRRSLR